MTIERSSSSTYALYCDGCSKLITKEHHDQCIQAALDRGWAVERKIEGTIVSYEHYCRQCAFEEEDEDE